jgi:hypothetical protein
MSRGLVQIVPGTLGEKVPPDENSDQKRNKNFEKTSAGPAVPEAARPASSEEKIAAGIVRLLQGYGWDIMPDGSFVVRPGFSEGRKVPPALREWFETHREAIIRWASDRAEVVAIRGHQPGPAEFSARQEARP